MAVKTERDWYVHCDRYKTTRVLGECRKRKRHIFTPTQLRNISPSFNGHFSADGPGLADTIMPPFWILLKLRMMEVVSGYNWSYGSCKAPVKSSPPTNQHPAFSRPNALPVTKPTVSEHWRETVQVICVPKISKIGQCLTELKPVSERVVWVFNLLCFHPHPLVAF